MAAPTVRAVGTVANNQSAIAPGLPSGTVAGDLLIMLLETNNQAITVSGWTEAPSSPQSSAGFLTRLTIFYKIAAGGDDTTTSDSGDHQIGRIIGIQAGTFNAANPFNASNGGKYVETTNPRIMGAVTTTVADCLILMCIAKSQDVSSTTGWSAWTNANLSSITERMDNNTTFGTGGGFGAATGEFASTGSTGTSEVTATNLDEHPWIVLAIEPAAAVVIPSLVMAPPIAA